MTLPLQIVENGSLSNIITERFFVRFAINFISTAVLVGLIHYRLYKKKEYVFTYFMMNITLFFIAFILQNVSLSMGASFGLFAVFSVMRYRTEDITQKDMTYLFIVIALGVISAVTNGTWVELLIYNGIIIFITFLLEGNLIMRRELSQNILFENIELIKAENRDKLTKELISRTGLNIHRIRIGKIDYLRDSAVINVYYYE